MTVGLGSKSVSSTPSGAAGGDLNGTYPNPGVAKWNGTAITTPGGAIATGKVPRITGGGNVCDWGAVDLANAVAVTGILPFGNHPTVSGTTAATAGIVKFNVTAPAAVGTADVGVSNDAARSDHVHAHGVQTDGTFHAAATSSTAGFMSAVDKTTFDVLVGSDVLGTIDVIFNETILTMGTGFIELPNGQLVGQTTTISLDFTGADGAGKPLERTKAAVESVLGLSNGLMKASGGVVSAATLVNADVSSSAAIAGTKISPAFGSQNITNTGAITCTGTITASTTLTAGTALRINTTPQATVGVAGAASALPATPTGYMPFSVNGTTHVFPYYLP